MYLSRKNLKWLTFSNVSLPPNRGRGEEEIVLSQVTIGKNCNIGGDFNGHSPSWDTETTSFYKMGRNSGGRLESLPVEGT